MTVKVDYLPKGIAFTRLAIAIALARGDDGNAARMAELRWGENSATCRTLKGLGHNFNEMLTKAAVSGGTTGSGNWAAEIVSAESAATEFFGLVRERSLIGRIAGIRRIPLRTRLVTAATGFAAAWVGEGQAVPVSSATYDEGTLPPRKLAALTVVSDDLLRSTDPAAELMIRNDLVNACVEALNSALIDPANSGTTDVKPASITNGLGALSSSGNGLTDLRELINVFPGDLERAVLIGSASSFAALHDPETLPGIGVRGGEAIGIPAIPAPAAGDDLILVDPDGIALGEGEMQLRVSTEGTIEMESEPTQDGTTPTAAQQVSLWQSDSIAIMAEKVVNWEVARPSVALLSGVAAS